MVYVVPGADEPRQSFRRYRAVAAALLVSAAVVALAASRCGRMAALATLRCVRACVRICVPADGAGAVCWLTARPLAVLQPRQHAAGGDGGSAGRTGSRDGAEGAAALASVKNPNRPRRQQSLVVTGRSTGQQLAWLNAGAVADANIFNHPVRVCVFSRLRGHSLVLQLRTHAPHARTHARNARTHAP